MYLNKRNSNFFSSSETRHTKHCTNKLHYFVNVVRWYAIVKYDYARPSRSVFSSSRFCRTMQRLSSFWMMKL